MRNPRVAETLSVITHGGKQISLPSQLCAARLPASPVSGVGATLMTADGSSGQAIESAWFM
jgi:hypothetical protein